MGNKPQKKPAKEPVSKGFGNDKLGSIVRKERHKIEAATEWDEVEAIRKSVTNYDFTSASAPENLAHNRYPNVLALEDTRVKLTDQYINANWIDGYHRNSKRAYIATQAPLEESFDRFWSMVWHSRAGVIVMLTNFVESQKRKADQYWPKQPGESVTYGDFEVAFLEETPVVKTDNPNKGKSGQYTAFIIRKFGLKNLSSCKNKPVKSGSKRRTKAKDTSDVPEGTSRGEKPFGSRTDVSRSSSRKNKARTGKKRRRGGAKNKNNNNNNNDNNSNNNKEEENMPRFPQFLETTCNENPFFKPVGHYSFLSIFHFSTTSPKTAQFELTPQNLQLRTLEPSLASIVIRCYPYKHNEISKRWSHTWPKKLSCSGQRRVFPHRQREWRAFEISW
eukprot:TRINITY_DN2407_c0_g1_i3.p1 TRINITY_DN2407_c0_g1~~TRINITY_DN2407_c0_g1_i3.p1  ORF type:complete len:390 (+),score=71.63 TRINITY_DN2407_c0_g1_i3:35-1204(+)